MPGDGADVLDEAFRRALGLEEEPDDRREARRSDATSHLVHAAERALRVRRAELSVLLCLTACRSGAMVEGPLEDILSAAFAVVRCLRVIPDAHPGGACAVAWSPDEVLLASGGADARVMLWSGEEAQPIASLVGHQDRVRRIEFNEVWPLASSCGDDGAAIVWDIASREEAWRVEGRDASALAARFSPCGRRVAVAGGSDWSGLHDARTGELLFAFRGHDGVAVYDAAFSPDGRLLATCGDDGRAIIWDVASAAVLAEVEHKQPVRSVAFDPAGARVACASYDGSISVLTIAGGARHIVAGQGDRAYAAGFVGDGGLWVAYEHGEQRLIRDAGLATESVRALNPPGARLLATCARRNGRVVATADHDGVAQIHMFEVEAPPLVFCSAGVATLGIDLTGDGMRAATADADGSVRLWSVDGQDAAGRGALRGQQLRDAAAAWRRSSGRALTRRELELLSIDDGSGLI